MATGRTTEPRTVTVTRTSGSTAVTATGSTFNRADVGQPITGTGIPAGATLTAVTSPTAATLSNAATSSGSGTVTLGGGVSADQTYGFRGTSPETETEADAYSVTAVNAGVVPPDRITNATTAVAQRGKA